MSHSSEAKFPGDNEYFPESSGWKSPEYKFWALFFKTISDNDDVPDYPSQFSKEVEGSKDGKINWDFWTRSSKSRSSSSSSGYTKAITVLTERVSKGDFSLGQDDVKKFGTLIKAIISHRDSQLKPGSSTHDNHLEVQKLWTKFQVALSKVKAKEDGPSFTMVSLAAIAVIALFWYLQQESKNYA